VVETPPLPELETLFELLPEFELFEFVVVVVTGLPESLEPLMPPALNEFLFFVTVTTFDFTAESVP